MPASHPFVRLLLHIFGRSRYKSAKAAATEAAQDQGTELAEEFAVATATVPARHRPPQPAASTEPATAKPATTRWPVLVV